MTRINSRQRVTLALSIAAGLALTLTACKRADPETAKVNEAARLIETAGDGNTPQDAAFQQAAQAAQGVSRDTREGVSTAAAILEAAALQQVAGNQAADARAEVSKALADLEPIVAEFRVWADLLAEAQGIAADDPSNEINTLRSGAADLADLVSSRTQALERLTEERDTLAARIALLDADSSSLRNEAAELETRAAAMGSEVAALELAPRIRELTREADALDLNAATLRGQVGVLDPQIAAATARVQETRDQRAFILEQAEDIEAARAAAESRALAAQARADESAAAAVAAYAELATFITTTANPAVEQAAGTYERAASAANKARGNDRAAAQLEAATARRRVGALLEEAALAYERVANYGAKMVAAGIPNASAIEANHDSIMALATQAKPRAAQSLRDAADAFDAARVRNGEPFDNTAEALRRRANELDPQPQAPAFDQQQDFNADPNNMDGQSPTMDPDMNPGMNQDPNAMGGG